MSRSLARSLVVVIALAPLSGCELLQLTPSTPGADAGGGACDDPITVGEGLTPVFEWEGAAAGLGVAHFPDGADRTWTLSMVTDPFVAPVTYGTVPTNAVEAEGAAVALESGVDYSVTITLAPSEGGGALCAIFTP